MRKVNVDSDCQASKKYYKTVIKIVHKIHALYSKFYNSFMRNRPKLKSLFTKNLTRIICACTQFKNGALFSFGAWKYKLKYKQKKLHLMTKLWQNWGELFI